jgi:hypothetical protein
MFRDFKIYQKEIMQQMTIKEYATYKNISVQAVHKRLKNIKNYPEIRSVKRISIYLFVLKINTGNDLAKKFKLIKNKFGLNV